MADERARRAVRDSLNGDFDAVDPALRRALFALCTNIDEHAVSSEAAHIELMEVITETSSALESKVDRVTKLLVTATVTFVMALATGLLNLIIN